MLPEQPLELGCKPIFDNVYGTIGDKFSGLITRRVLHKSAFKNIGTENSARAHWNAAGIFLPLERLTQGAETIRLHEKVY